MDASPVSSTSGPESTPGQINGRATRRKTATGRTLSAVSDSGAPAVRHRVPMDKDRWYMVPTSTDDHAYRDAEVVDPTGDLGRGVYKRNSGGLEWMAPLPYVHGRILHRNADGDISAVSYLLSADLDSPHVLINDDEIRSGNWAQRLEMVLSEGRSIIAVAATAIRMLSKSPDVPVREATPTVSELGRISIADHRSLPAGYLRTAPAASAEPWQAVAGILAGSPALMTLVVGASCFGPFTGPLRRDTHVIDMYGDQGQGKTTTERLAGAVWGNPGSDSDGGTVVSWDLSPIGIGRHASELGILPVFTDESGMAEMGARDRARFVFRMSESGGARMVAKRYGPGNQRSRRWRGVFFVTGNGQFVDVDACSGDLAGVLRRTLSLEGPFTANAADAERIDKVLIPAGYGWLGREILARYSVADAARLVEWAETTLGLSAEAVARSLTRHLAGAVAGAAMMDEILGTGESLQGLAIVAARAHIDQYGHEPRHDADRLIDAVRASIAASPAAWPHVWEYLTQEQERPNELTPLGRPRLPQRGVLSSLSGLRADDDSRILILPDAMVELCERLNLSRPLACKRLYERGQLHVPPRRRAKGEWIYRERIEGRDVAGYVLTVSPWTDPDTDEGVETAPAADAPAAPEPTLADQVQAWLAALPGQIKAMDAAQLAALDWAEMAAGVRAGHITDVQLGRIRALADQRAAELAAPDAAPVPIPAPRPAARSDRQSAPAGAAARRQRPAATSKDDVAERRPTAVGSRPELDAELLSRARAMEPDAGRKLLDSKSIAEGMRLLIESRETARYQFVKFPPPAEPLIRERGAKSDSVWEGRPKWYNPAVDAGTAVDRLDVNAAYLSAMNTNLPNGKLEWSDDGEFDTRRSGIYRIDQPEWKHAHLPNPLGAREESGTIIVARPHVKLLFDLAARGYYDAPPRIHESWTSGGSEAHLRVFRDVLRDYRQQAIDSGDLLLEYWVKQIYSKTVSTMGDSSSNFEVRRSDWEHIIRVQAYCNLWLRAEKAHKGGLVVAQIGGTDELHVVGDWRSLVDAKGKPVFPEGRKLTEIKTKGVYEWEPPVSSRRTRRAGK